jgi:hypothetical protein
MRVALDDPSAFEGAVEREISSPNRITISYDTVFIPLNKTNVYDGGSPRP